MKIDVPTNDDDFEDNTTSPLTTATIVPSITSATKATTTLNDPNESSFKELLESVTINSKSLKETIILLLDRQDEQEKAIKKLRNTLNEATIISHHGNDNNKIPTSSSSLPPVLPLIPAEGNLDHHISRQLSGISISDSPSFIAELELQQELDRLFKEQQRLFPDKFIQFPRDQDGLKRATRYEDVVEAINSLSQNTEEQQKMMTFLTQSVETAMGKIKRRANDNQLALSWTHQSDFTRNYVTQWLIKVTTEHVPSIPLGLCEKNWISRYLIQKNWYDNVKAERLLQERDDAASPRKRKYQHPLTSNYSQQPIWISDDDEDDDNNNDDAYFPVLTTTTSSSLEEYH